MATLIYTQTIQMSTKIPNLYLTFFCYKCKIKLSLIERRVSMTLGECINNFLTEKNMSMRAFAEKAGVSHTYISHIINGRPNTHDMPTPTIQKYKAFAKVMGIDVNDLIDIVDDKIAWGNAEPINLTPEESALVLAWRMANLEDRQMAAYALRKYGLSVPVE